MDTIRFIAKEEIKLQDFLKENHISKRATNKLIRKGISVNGKLMDKNIRLRKNDIVEIPIKEEEIDYEPIEGKLDIVYEDKNLLVINKPSGLTMNSKNQVNLSNNLAYYFKEEKINRKIRLINRLDMNTSGLMLVAKNKYSQAYYQKQLEKNKLRKKYLALAEGRIDIDKKVKINILYDKENKYYYHGKDGKEAITIFKSLKRYNDFTLIEAEILTGKTHQIRASLKELGHPIVGDYLYGSKYEMDRFLLHSYYLEFNEFLSGDKKILNNSPDFDQYIEKLGL